MLLFHLFAYYIQLYNSVDPCSISSQNRGRKEIETGIDKIEQLMNRIELKLNKEKLEFIMIVSFQ